MSTADASLARSKPIDVAPLRAEARLRDGQAIIAALDNAPLTRRHRVFLAALLAALTFDYAKPVTLSFVIPGMRAMWKLSAVEGSYLAVAGLSGTVLGSFFWGFMADRIGRRLTLIWTVSIFTISCLCGLGQQYWHSLLACLVMGFGVGGEAPIVFALAAEYVPVKVRAQSLLFMGMIGWLGGYVMAAAIATIFRSFLPESEAWRWMWLVQMLPAVLIIGLRSKIVPESARYLLNQGRVEEARSAAESMVGPIQPARDLAHEESGKVQPMAGPTPRLYGRTVALSFFSFAVGLVNFGFTIWLPTLLSTVGFTGGAASGYLALSALIALPALVITSLVLIRWGTLRTLVSYAVGGGLALSVLGLGASSNLLTPAFLVPVTSLIFFFITSIGGAFSFYGAEVFPTTIRVRRSGIVAALGKFGGVVGPYLGGVWLAGGGSWLGLQLPLAIALMAGAVVLAVMGVETHGRTLEQIVAA